MTVLITLTSVGTDTGPFNLLSDVDGYSVPFETNVNKVALTMGYTSSLVPDAATSIKVQSFGGCSTYINITLTPATSTTTSSSTAFPPSSTTSSSTAAPTTTTTSSSTSSTTTTTTTLPVFAHHISVARPDPTAACAETSYPITVYSTSSTLFGGSIVYTTAALTTPYPGGGNWYKYQFLINRFSINGSGVISAPASC